MPAHRAMKKEKAKNFKGSMLHLLDYIKEYHFRIVFVLILVVCSTIFSVVGPKIAGGITTKIYEGIVGKVTGGSGIDFDAIFKIVTTMAILYACSALINYVSNLIMVKTSVDLTYRLRDDVSKKINRLPLKFFDKHSHGEVLSRVTNDVDTIANNLSNTITQMLSSVVTVIGVLYMMFSISFKLTIVALCVLPLTAFCAAFIVKHSQKYFYKQQSALGEANGLIEEMYSGHLVVKAYNYEDKSIKDFDKINKNLEESAHKSQFYSAIMMPVTGFIGNLIYVAVCLLGGYEAINGRITVGDIQALIQYVRNLNQPVSQASQLLSNIQSMAAAAERIFEILDEQEEEPDCANPVSIYDDNGDLTIKGNVSFENVRFGYDLDNIVIKDFSMYVKPGQNVAIVGPTGAGKTTLVKLLMRFYELNGGTIYVDGHDIKDYTRSDLRSLFGMVLQDTWLYSGSIKDNIKYGKLDATDEEVYAACKMAHVHHFIKTLDQGYDTQISDETSGISQGQKQLLTIARAFLKDPKILILDEATSSVDTRTEELIQQAMEKLMENRTSFVIAHRLSTIKNADIIIVLDKGDVVEVGNHQELLAKKGFYYNLYNSQFEE